MLNSNTLFSCIQKFTHSRHNEGDKSLFNKNKELTVFMNTVTTKMKLNLNSLSTVTIYLKNII